jgi:hypothetical protein
MKCKLQLVILIIVACVHLSNCLGNSNSIPINKLTGLPKCDPVDGEENADIKEYDEEKDPDHIEKEGDEEREHDHERELLQNMTRQGQVTDGSPLTQQQLHYLLPMLVFTFAPLIAIN